MSNRFIIFSLLLILLSATSPVRAADPPNDDKPGTDDVAQEGTLLPIDLANPSFEDGTDTPTNWMPLFEEIDGTYLWETEFASVGQRSLSISRTRYDYGRWSSDVIDVQKAGFSWHTLTGDVKTAENNGEVYLSIAWFDSQDAMITTSDSEMLPPGDTDWQQVALNALPPDGAVSVRVWCISNHNHGQTWFDNLKLTVTQLPAVGKVDYDQFLKEHPAHLLALTAHLMQVQALMTEAKWIREEGFYDPDAQKRASQLYAQAAAIARNDSVLQKAAAAAGKDLAQEKERFESWIDIALWEAIKAANNGDDIAKLRQYLSKVVERDRDPDQKAAAEAWIKGIDAETKLND